MTRKRRSRELDHTAEPERQGDYYLLRAQILDAQGKVQEAAAALNQGIRAAPQKPFIYYQTTSFLLKHKLYRRRWRCWNKRRAFCLATGTCCSLKR